MATKYCDVSLATGLNDGTSTANAWQSLVDVLDGTPVGGSYAAGDIIIIRTADGGGNLSESRATSLTTPVKSGTDQDTLIEWRFDDGTVWAQSGTFELTFTGGTSWSITNFNWINAGHSGTRRLQVIHNAATDFDLFGDQNKIWGLNLTRSTTPGTANETRYKLTNLSAGEYHEAVNCRFAGTTPIGGGNIPSNGALCEISGLAYHSFRGCEFVLNSSKANDYIFLTPSSSQFLVEMIGCAVSDAVSSHAILFNSFAAATRNATIYMKDTSIGDIDEAQRSTVAASNSHFEIISESSGGASFFKRTPQALVRYDPAGNYPTLSATLPDVGTSWSVQVWPDDDNCSILRAARIGAMSKWYNATAATKDIRLEVLIKDTTAFISPQKDEWWIEVDYIDDSTGDQIHATTLASGALTTSTASWSATTYGGNNYDKYKFVITTANSIKQYTFVSVTLYSTKPAINAASSASGDFYFIDPDFQIE